MLDEIRSQPEVIRTLVSSERDNIRLLAKEIGDRGINFSLIAARGTSDNAATYAKYLLGIIAGIPVGLAAPSIFTLYGAHPRLDHSLVIGVSQSGQAADVTEYLENSKKCGALTACVTNEDGSPITKVSDFTILCHAGLEKSVAATKTYTSTLAALAMLSFMLGGRDDLLASLAGIGDKIGQVISSLEDEIARRAERYRYMNECFVLARGINYATAFEGALKLAETCYVNAERFSSADFMHGPIAMINEDIPCFLYAPSGAAFDSMIGAARKLKDRNAELIIVSDNDEILSMATTPFKIPFTVEEELSPIIYIVVGQLFAQYLAIAKKHDPDHPRGLSKVTITR
ncbi:MAG: SIS domain-containing protein [Armatimonadota bacterium]